MKKISLVRAGAFLLVLTMASSCFVGGTFAKYVSTGEGQDNARVAKWGVEVTVTGDGFKTTYGKDDGSSNVAGNTVVGELDAKVVAPGTGGTFGGVTIEGQPEVAVKVQTIANVQLTGWNIGKDGEFYCPLVFTIGDQTICGLHYSKENAGGQNSFEAAIKKAIQDATTMELEAGTRLSEIGDEITYSWEWPFVEADHDDCGKDPGEDQEDTWTHVHTQTDDLDTVLGSNAADADGGNDPTIHIDVTTTVTQID